MNDLIITEQSAVYKLFYQTFHCKVPYHSTISYESIERYGIYTSHNSDTSAYELVDKLLTPVAIATNFQAGVAIELVYPKDSEVIYRLIMEHLKMWLDYGINFGIPYEPPMDDLYVLDSLAKALYYKACCFGNLREYEDDLFDLLDAPMAIYDNEFSYKTGHEDIIAEIAELRNELGDYRRYGY